MKKEHKKFTCEKCNKTHCGAEYLIPLKGKKKFWQRKSQWVCEKCYDESLIGDQT